MKIRPIHFVPDVAQALRFYEALGLRADARARPDHWVELVASGGELALHDGAVADDGAGRSGIQFNLLLDEGESLEAVEARLREADFPPDGTIVDHEWGRSLYVPGPGGLVVQIDERDRELYT